MFHALGQLTVRRRRTVLALSAIFLVLAGVLGTGVFSQLSGGGFDDPSSESTRAEQALRDEFHGATPNLVLLLTADGSVVGSAARPAVDRLEVASTGREVL